MIEGDQLWAITHNYNLLKNPNFNQEHSDKVEETFNILDMFRTLHYPYSNLSPDDKDELTRYCRYIPNFKGFDGSNDDHYWITKTIINDLNLYDEFKTIDLNSHSMTTLESY